MKKKSLLLTFIGAAFVGTSCTGAVLAKNLTVANNVIGIKKNVTDVYLTFDANGGSLSCEEGRQASIKTKSDVQFSSLTDVPTATREGYNFMNWYYGDNIPVESTTTFSSNTTLKAQWGSSYTVTFDPGEGKFAAGTDPIKIAKGKIYSDEIETPTCTNKAFDGWYIGNTKQEFPYRATSNATLTAKYTEDKIDVGVNASGGYFGDTTTDTYRKLSVKKGITWSELKSQVPQTINYDGDKIFSKWTSKGSDLTDDTTFTSTTIIRANYDTSVSITFNPNGGTFPDSSTSAKQSKKYKAGDASATLYALKVSAGFSTEPSKGSYAISGWYSDTIGDGDAQGDDITSLSGNHVLYAIYKEPHSFTFSSEKDTSYTISDLSSDTYVIKDSVSFKVNPVTGYTLGTGLKIYKDSGKQTEFTNYSYSINDGVGTVTINEHAPSYDLYVYPESTKNKYTISVSASPSGGGTVTGAATGVEHGTSHTVTATANTGYTFTKWTEDGTQVSTDASYTFTATANRTLVANFTLNNYTITAVSLDPSKGTVSGGGTYAHGTSVTLTATPIGDYEFDCWYEDGSKVSGAGATYTFTAEKDRSLSAQFAEKSYTISKSESYCTLSWTPTEALRQGTTVTVTCTPTAGCYGETYTVKDAGGNEITVTDNTFTMPASNVTITGTASYKTIQVNPMNYDSNLYFQSGTFPSSPVPSYQTSINGVWITIGSPYKNKTINVETWILGGTIGQKAVKTTTVKRTGDESGFKININLDPSQILDGEYYSLYFSVG